MKLSTPHIMKHKGYVSGSKMCYKRLLIVKNIIRPFDDFFLIPNNKVMFLAANWPW